MEEEWNEEKVEEDVEEAEIEEEVEKRRRRSGQVSKLHSVWIMAGGMGSGRGWRVYTATVTFCTVSTFHHRRHRRPLNHDRLYFSSPFILSLFYLGQFSSNPAFRESINFKEANPRRVLCLVNIPPIIQRKF